MKNSTTSENAKNAVHHISNNPIAAELIKVGEEGINPGDDRILNPYFSDDYVIHMPGGEMTFAELKAFWDVWRNALTDFKITREQIIVEGNFIGARNTFSGTFENELSTSVIGPIQPNGKEVNIEVINTFRYNDEGLLAEEWVQFDNLNMLKQFGVDLLAGR